MPSGIRTRTKMFWWKFRTSETVVRERESESEKEGEGRRTEARLTSIRDLARTAN